VIRDEYGSAVQSGVSVVFHGGVEENKPRRPSADMMHVVCVSAHVQANIHKSIMKSNVYIYYSIITLRLVSESSSINRKVINIKTHLHKMCGNIKLKLILRY
jgi:hypothetical protein